MSEENQLEDSPQSEQEQRNLRRTFIVFIGSLWKFLQTTLSLREGAEFENTIDGIKRDIDFKGHNVWILICSITIASIGLNVNSNALIIGAMLISPLMGPILGIGLSVGTNDLKTLIRSVKSLGVAAGISILTSTVYFLITPLGEVQSELIARTEPTLLDVLVAIAGGMAGIIAWTRKIKNTNVIPGVAIATALMPPLCTAGFGLARGNFDFFFGASYLFIINSVFISLSTLLIVRYLRFPMVQFVDSLKEKKVKRYITFSVLLVCIPSAFTFWNAIQEGIFKASADRFITENFVFEGTDVMNSKLSYSDKKEAPSRIEVYMLGKPISQQIERELNTKMERYNLENTTLKIYQNKTETDEIVNKVGKEMRTGIIEDLYEKNAEKLAEKDEIIHDLELTIAKIEGKSIPFENIKREVKVQYDDCVKLGYANAIETHFGDTQDTVPTFYVSWKTQEDETSMEIKRRSLEKWLRVRLEDNRIKVIDL